MILFTVVLVLQFVSMLFHRWGTIIEILASTRLFSKHHKYRDSKLTIKEAVDLIKEMELERDGAGHLNLLDSRTTNSTTMSSEQEEEEEEEEDNTHAEPDPDYDVDILPEPQADYFEHPAVRKSSYNASNANNVNPSLSNGNQSFARDAFVTPNPLLSHHHQGEMTQSQLKPLQSLDARVMKQFRALEQKDPRFRRKTKSGSGPNAALSRFRSPGGTEYNYSQI